MPSCPPPPNLGPSCPSASEPSSLRARRQDLGIGAGLRVKHYADILETGPQVGFFEAISENFLVEGGKPLYYLDQVAERYPVVLHGVSLSIGAPEEPSREYLARLKKLVTRVNPPWVTDHFCFGGAGGAHVHDLLPLPYTSEMVRRVARRIREVEDYLERPLGLENTSSYLSYRESHMTEWEFISAVLEESNAGLLLDVNNIFVSAYNHGFNPLTFLENIPLERVLQMHLAGHTNYGKYIIDTHCGPVPDPVLTLYKEATRRLGSVSTLLEWDDEIPDLPVLVAELDRLAAVRQEGLEPGHEALTRFDMPRPPCTPQRKLALSGGGAENQHEVGSSP